MTIPVDVAELDLATDGATKVFNLSGGDGALYFMAASDLKVWFVDEDGAGTLLTYGVDYTIGGNGRTGTGTLTTLADDAYADDGYLAVRRNTSRLQPEAWADNDGFAAATMQNTQDRGRLIDQDDAMRIERALSAPLYETALGLLPRRALRKGLVLAFDAITGDPTVVDPMVTQAEAARDAAIAAAAGVSPKVPSIRTISTAGPHDLTEDDEIVYVTYTPNTLRLPPLPVLSRKITVKDKVGDADVNNITFETTDGKLIDGEASAIIGSQRGSLTLSYQYGDAEWSIL